jgi:hypothetical protein
VLVVLLCLMECEVGLGSASGDRLHATGAGFFETLVRMSLLRYSLFPS